MIWGYPYFRKQPYGSCLPPLPWFEVLLYLERCMLLFRSADASWAQRCGPAAQIWSNTKKRAEGLAAQLGVTNVMIYQYHDSIIVASYIMPFLIPSTTKPSINIQLMVCPNGFVEWWFYPVHNHWCSDNLFFSTNLIKFAFHEFVAKEFVAKGWEKTMRGRFVLNAFQQNLKLSPGNWWLGDDPFLLGFGFFWGIC